MTSSSSSSSSLSTFTNILTSRIKVKPFPPNLTENELKLQQEIYHIKIIIKPYQDYWYMKADAKTAKLLVDIEVFLNGLIGCLCRETNRTVYFKRTVHLNPMLKEDFIKAIRQIPNRPNQEHQQSLHSLQESIDRLSSLLATLTA